MVLSTFFSFQSGRAAGLFAVVALCTAMLTLSACAGRNIEADYATVKGTALYRERMALPPGAELTVTLQDISRADAPAKVLGVQTIPSPGNPPYKFSIAYDTNAIDRRHTYSISASIRIGDKLLFITDTVYPVLTRGAPDTADLLLKRVSR